MDILIITIYITFLDKKFYTSDVVISHSYVVDYFRKDKINCKISENLDFNEIK